MLSEAVTHNRIDWVKCPPSVDHMSPAARLRMTAESMEGFAMSKKIPLSQGMFAIVDDADFEWLSRHKWHLLRNGPRTYAVRHDHRFRPCRQVRMHRAILNPGVGLEVDHHNGDGLDNQRVNLRPCTSSQNNMNAKKRSGCSSIYKGVWWDKGQRKWRAGIQKDRQSRRLGAFQNEQDAARAYNAAAITEFGEFALLNVIEEGQG